MTIIDIGSTRRVRLRCGAFDEAFKCAASHALTLRARAAPPMQARQTSAAAANILLVEYYRAVGARSHFCALGAQFIAAPNGDLSVRVMACGEPTTTVSGTISTTQVPVYAGIPAESGDAILPVAVQEAERSSLAPGLLEFWGGAYNHVDSSPALFAMVAAALVQLIALPAGSLNDARVAEAFGIPPLRP